MTTHMFGFGVTWLCIGAVFGGYLLLLDEWLRPVFDVTTPMANVTFDNPN